MKCYNCLKEIENSKTCENCGKNQIYDTLKFNVAGVTFKNEQEKDIQGEIKKILLEYERNDCFEKYGGYTNSEIKELKIEVSEFEDATIEINLKEDIYENKPCIKIYLKRYDGKYCHVGFMPKKLVKKYLQLKQNFKEVTIEANLVGGKIKQLEHDYITEKDKIEIVELTYGFEVNLTFYNDKKQLEQEKEKNKQKVIEEWNRLKEEQEIKIQEEKPKDKTSRINGEELKNKDEEFTKINTTNNIIVFIVTAIISIPFIWLFWIILSFVFWIINF